MLGNNTTTINSIFDFILILVIPFLAILLLIKSNILLVKNYYHQKVANKNHIGTKKLLILVTQPILSILMENIPYLLPLKLINIELNFFLIQILPIMSITAIIQIFIIASMLIRDDKRKQKWHNVRMALFCVLLVFVNLQFIAAITELHNL